jgi:hypothetical protein
VPKFIAPFVSLLALPASAQIGNPVWAEDAPSHRNASTISVLDYGADPTGDRDSTAAFNAALKAAANIVAPGGDGSGTNTCVVVHPTTGGKTGYLISRTIQLRSMCLQSTGGLVWNNSPCAPGNPQDWLAVQINGATYFPACRP